MYRITPILAFVNTTSKNDSTIQREGTRTATPAGAVSASCKLDRTDTNHPPQTIECEATRTASGNRSLDPGPNLYPPERSG
jgi:hypothetical protein